MREIEFRFWNKEKKVMCYKNEDNSATYWDGVYCSILSLINSHLKRTEGYEIMQFTGLTDKNGTKIFEGDIVRLYDKMCNIHWTAIVEFGNPNGEYNWGYQLKLLKILEPTGTKNCYWNKDILVWVEMPDVECEVIGNVCDNPELIEKVEE